MPFLSSACFLAIPARSTAPSTPRVPLNHVFSGPLGIMLVTLALYDVGSAVFRNGYTQGSIAYGSIHGTAASWMFSCLIAGAVVGYAWWLQRKGQAIETAWVTLALACLISLYLIALLIISYASRQLQKNTLRDGSDDNASNQRIEEYFKSQYALTQREYEILELLARGYSQKKIAEELVLSVGSVQSYSKAVYRKLHIHSKQEAINLVDRERGSLS